MYLNSLFISFGGKDKYNLCKHLGEADFCGQVRYNKCDIITSELCQLGFGEYCQLHAFYRN